MNKKTVDTEEIAQQIRQIVAEVLETEPKEISDDAKFVKDLGMDSMMALEIIAAIEKRYKIVIPEEMLSQFTDVNSSVALIKHLMNGQ